MRAPGATALIEAAALRTGKKYAVINTYVRLNEHLEEPERELLCSVLWSLRSARRALWLARREELARRAAQDDAEAIHDLAAGETVGLRTRPSGRVPGWGRGRERLLTAARADAGAVRPTLLHGQANCLGTAALPHGGARGAHRRCVPAGARHEPVQEDGSAASWVRFHGRCPFLAGHDGSQSLSLWPVLVGELTNWRCVRPAAGTC
eukprot:scaffold994_cov226-Prasinococcus_capsulatus_cf.AAC.9